MNPVEGIDISSIRTPRLAAIILLFGLSAQLHSCPLCDALATTISDDLRDARTVVLARVVDVERDAPKTGPHYARFEIVRVLKNSGIHASSLDTIESPDRSQWVYTNDVLPREQLCLLLSYTSEDLQWTLPLPLSTQSARYVSGLIEMPEDGNRRLEYFLPYLQSTETMIADDAYNEFARRPMSDIGRIRNRLDRAAYIAMLRDPETKPRLRSLLWMLLSLCGRTSDTQLFDEAIAANNLQTESIHIDLPASIACYIVLGGEAALRRIERDFLKDRMASTSNIHAAISALRVVGQEFDCYSLDRLSRCMHLALERSDLADFVIPDLARWEDWTAFEQLEQLFFDADEDSSFVRIPIINYMHLCPHPNAASALQKMERADPNSARRAAMISGRFQRRTNP
jgi:hypothetical protein